MLPEEGRAGSQVKLTGQDSSSNSNVGLQPEPSLLKKVQIFQTFEVSALKALANRHIITGSILTQQGLLVILADPINVCEPPLHVGLGVKLLVGLQVVLEHIVSRALAAPVTDLETSD